ncbi:hypothetical protein NB640_01370 [Oxalobacter vibrioformis]|uniref:Uncharacterized protein n=1 Tax=Oxalobacter vibrioformis TaxID=933080 RepID=A0A9E9LZE9_9BURK|nr:hypothetical protein [Oxalobacter vibrioformis]WAW10344.1 hypothetical protein NB640_01370 [Oxalobacter vibrioformis]
MKRILVIFSVLAASAIHLPHVCAKDTARNNTAAPINDSRTSAGTRNTEKIWTIPVKTTPAPIRELTIPAQGESRTAMTLFAKVTPCESAEPVITFIRVAQCYWCCGWTSLKALSFFAVKTQKM